MTINASIKQYRSIQNDVINTLEKHPKFVEKIKLFIEFIPIVLLLFLIYKLL